MSTVSTHVLDTALGKPAQGIPVTLECGGSAVGTVLTDADGRARDFPPTAPGPCRLVFSVGDYFKRAGRESLYTTIPIDFNVGDPSAHYHIPLLLSPFGYSTYRGS